MSHIHDPDERSLPSGPRVRVPGTPEPLAPGCELLGKYVVERVLGEGGMGTVYSVRHTVLGRSFAMKTLARDLADDASARRRFVREARATASIQSECVARALDVGDLEDGTPYMVFELLEGRSLAAFLGARMEPGPVVCMALQILEALVEAHGAGIVHRDLKPENVFVVGDDLSEPRVKVLDFGIAKQLGRPTTTLELMGTASYIAPEQLERLAVDGRADLFALGVTLHECLSGANPFEGKSLAQTFANILGHAPPALPDDLDPRLVAIVGRALAKNPDDRFASADEMASALRPLLPEALAPLVPGPKGKHPSRQTTTRELPTEPVQLPAPKARMRRGLVLLALLLPPAILSADEPARLAAGEDAELPQDATCSAPPDDAFEAPLARSWSELTIVANSEATASARRQAPIVVRKQRKPTHAARGAEDLARRGAVALLAAASARPI